MICRRALASGRRACGGARNCSARRPDLEVVELRGNVPTRLNKVETGQVHAAILAAAGLIRLEVEQRITMFLEPPDWLPAAGQGAIAIQVRSDDPRMRELLLPLDHAPTSIATRAERAFLAALEGGCQVPIGSLVTERRSRSYIIWYARGPERQTHRARVPRAGPRGSRVDRRSTRRRDPLARRKQPARGASPTLQASSPATRIRVSSFPRISTAPSAAHRRASEPGARDASRAGAARAAGVRPRWEEASPPGRFDARCQSDIGR